MSMRSLGFGPGVVLLMVVMVAASRTVGVAVEPTDIRGTALDLHTLTSVADGWVFRGEPLQNVSVGAIDDDWFIGISVPEGTEAGEAIAYLCNGAWGIWLEGAITDGVARLQSGDTVLQFEGDGTFTGTVTIDGGEPRAFSATEAGSDAGLFRAVYVSGPEGSATDPAEAGGYVGGWVVLSATSMRGSLDWFEDEEPTAME